MKIKRAIKTSSDRWALSRRDLLRRLGVGAACLPILWAPRSAKAATMKRFIGTIVTGGYRQATWRPVDGPLASQTLPQHATPLEPYKNDLTFLPALRNPDYVGPNVSTYGTIFYGLPSVTTGAYPTPKGKTVDQVIVGSLRGNTTPNLALQVQIDLAPKQTAVGANRCFWAGPGLPVNPVADPIKTYQMLFTPLQTGADPAAVKQLLLDRKSILDYVGDGLSQFKVQLASDDRIALDAHFQGIRDLETQLIAIDAGAPNGCAGTAPATVDLTAKTHYVDIMRAQMDLIVAALRCGVTQVATLQLSDAVGANIDIAQFLPGIPLSTDAKTQTLQGIAHNPLVNGVDRKALVDEWYMMRFAEFLAKLKGIPEGGATLLDNSVVLWGNHMADGATRDGQNIPWILAGKCGGTFTTGQCMPAADKPLTGVLADICTAMGVPGAPFGASYGGLLV